MVGQGKLHQFIPMRKHFRSDVDFTHRALDAFRQFDTEYIFSFRFVDHIQPFGSLCYGSALYQQRKDGDKEYHIEYQSGVFYSRNHRVSGEDDRYGAAQTYPRYIQLSFKGEVFIRNQAKEHADRTGEDNHEDTDR